MGDRTTVWTYHIAWNESVAIGAVMGTETAMYFVADEYSSLTRFRKRIPKGEVFSTQAEALRAARNDLVSQAKATTERVERLNRSIADIDAQLLTVPS